MAHPNVHPVIAVQGGGATVAPTLLGQGPARIPTGGKIRAGIKVLTKKAAGEPKAQAIYEQGVAAGQSFEQIERAITEALPNLKTPLVPRNVPWFTVRAQDFPNPEIAREILDAYGEDRGEGGGAAEADDENQKHRERRQANAMPSKPRAGIQRGIKP